MSEDDKIKSSTNLKESLLSKTDTGEAKKQQLQQYVPKKFFGVDGNLIALSTMNFFLNAAVSVITPFYPGLAADKGVSTSLVGLIFALNPIGSFSVSLSIGQMMGKLGKKNLMFWGLVVQAITIITFGIVYYIENEGLFIAVSMLARFFQGASRSCYGAATFGYVPQLWPDTIQKKIGIMETMTAIGLFLGPMIGQALNNLAGNNAALKYQLPFYVLSGIFVFCIYTIKWLPPDIKNKAELDKVKALDCMKNAGVFWTFLLMTASAVANTYINPQYTQHMGALGLGESKAGYVVSVGAFFYMIFLHLMPYISKKLDKKFIIALGTLISIFAIFIQAPETYLGLPQGGDYWYLVTIGQSVNGIASAMVILPMIPELIELIVVNEMKIRQTAQPDLKMIRACSDMGSSIFVGGYSLGTFIGPLGAGLLYDAFDGNTYEKFMNESRIFAAFILVILVCYMVFGNGHLGIAATFKKWKLCEKRKAQNNESAIIQRQTALTHRNMANQQNNNNNNNNINNNTSITNNTQQSEIQHQQRQFLKPSQDENRESYDDSKFKQSDASDELLSDQSPIDVLSAGSGSQDVENPNGNSSSNEHTVPSGQNEKNTYYFE